MTVREFTDRMDRWFRTQNRLQSIGLRGEVSGLSKFGSGHLGFTLKDGTAVIQCVWFSDRQNGGVETITNGSQILAFGSVRIRPEKGLYQLVVESVELSGVGALFQKYEALKTKFRAEGLFERDRKKAVPVYPLHIALVSAERAKGAEDFIRAIRREVPFVSIFMVETRVQGDGAEIDIAAAIDAADKLPVDVIVVARGGGSYEDLFPFNLEPVVRAIVRSKKPVVTAIAHTEDHHLCDEVADRFFGTPSLAAEFFAKRWKAGIERLSVSDRDLSRALRNIVALAAQRADGRSSQLKMAWDSAFQRKRDEFVQIRHRLALQNPRQQVASQLKQVGDNALRLDAWPHRAIENWNSERSKSERGLSSAWASVHQRKARELEMLQIRLQGVDPNAPLARGYALVTQNGRLVRSAADVAVGSDVEAKLSHGSLRARVEEVKHDE